MNASSVTPNRNLTFLRTETAPSWVADAETRGTWSLLYSCVFTLSLCVWTAIHLNIPAAGESQRRQFFRKVKYLLLAIFAPETAVFTAWQQWSRARQIRDQLNSCILNPDKVSSTEPESGSQQHSSPIFDANISRDNINVSSTLPSAKDQKQISSQSLVTLTYGFYVVMGGFTVDVSDMHDKLSRLTLTPKGVLHLAGLGLLKNVLDDEIRDKSKADWLAKSLVILQVSWMILQCISRRAAGYPLSPLEVHTLVHAGCASVMYLLWFSKPLDVRSPTLIDTTSFEEPLALMLLQSPQFGWIQYGDIDIPDGYMRVSLAEALISKWPDKSASEASYLMFREPLAQTIEASSENPSTHEGETSKDTVDSLEPSASVMRYRSKGNISEASPDTGDLPSDLQDKAKNSDSVEEQIDLTWRSSPETSVACTLTSGDTLTQGIGPNGFPLRPINTPGKSFSRFKERLWKRKRNAPRRNLSPVSDDLSKSLPKSNVSNHRNRALYDFSMSLSSKDVLRWNRAGAQIRKSSPNHSPGLQDHFQYIQNSDMEDSECKYDFLTLRSRNLSMEAWSSVRRSDKEIETYLIFDLLMFLGILYGGVHLSLWNYDFATAVERLLWRISGISLVVVPMITSATYLALDFWLAYDGKRSERQSESQLEGARPSLTHRYSCNLFGNVIKLERILLGALFILIAIAGFVALALTATGILLYVFARVFLVVESFISLRHVPIGVYVQFGWSKYIPHI